MKCMGQLSNFAILLVQNYVKKLKNILIFHMFRRNLSENGVTSWKIPLDTKFHANRSWQCGDRILGHSRHHGILNFEKPTSKLSFTSEDTL